MDSNLFQVFSRVYSSLALDDYERGTTNAPSFLMAVEDVAIGNTTYKNLINKEENPVLLLAYRCMSLAQTCLSLEDEKRKSSEGA